MSTTNTTWSKAVRKALSAPKTGRSRFVAFRSSRHRTAAFALYRSLLRYAAKIPVPNPVQQPAVVNHPVTQAVRKGFDRNRGDDSLRLVFAAMTAGYKFLGLFSKAQTAGSAEHAQIIEYLDANPKLSRTSQQDQKSSVSSEASTRTPRERIPLLTSIERPGQGPQYVATNAPRPKEALKGERRVPRLAATAEGLPFLRIKKPQPVVLSRLLRRKGMAYKNAIGEIVYIEEEGATTARLEDEWDYLMDLELEKQAQQPPETRNLQSTYSWTSQVQRLWHEWHVERQWEDWIARGEAMHHIVERERALAEQEKLDSDSRSDADVSSDHLPNSISNPSGVSPMQPAANVNAIVDRNFANYSRLARKAAPGSPEPKRTPDLTMSERWAGLLQQQTSRVLWKTATELKKNQKGHAMLKKLERNDHTQRKRA